MSRRFDLVRYMATNGVAVASAGRITGTREYRAVSALYGDRMTRWTMLPLMNHIDEGIGVLPRFSETPGKIWRGSVPVGHDNELVYGKLAGVGAKELAALRARGVV